MPPRLNADQLQRFFEQLTDRLRGRQRLRSFDDEIIPVQVDLVGDGGQRLDATSHPFRSDANATSADAAGELAQAWSFRETVVLRRTQRGSRVLLYTTLGISGAGLLWILVAPLNQTIQVLGKLEPNAKVKLIQTPVSGVVDQVLVAEGEAVQAGQVLLRFDLRDARTQLASAESVRRQLQEENLTYAAALGDRPAMANLSANQRLRLANQAEELASRREAAEQELRRSITRVAGMRTSLRTADEIADRYERLVRSGAFGEVQALEARNKVQEIATNLAAEERDVARLRALLRSSRVGPGAELRGRIEANRRLIAEQDAKISTARQQLRYGELKAPVAGVVFDLDARRGSVAQAGQPLLRVVPGGALQAKVYIPSNVIGFIQPGQRADISLDTFPSQDYGRVEAVVERVGSDALTPEKQKEALGTEASGLHYPAVLTLKSQTLQAYSKTIPLRAGMGLSADIYLRQRPFLSVITGTLEDKRRSLERMR
jgi:HlyD family secretion protein